MCRILVTYSRCPLCWRWRQKRGYNAATTVMWYRSSSYAATTVQRYHSRSNKPSHSVGAKCYLGNEFLMQVLVSQMFVMPWQVMLVRVVLLVGFTLRQMISNCFCLMRYRIKHNRMSNDLDNFWRIDEVSIPFTVELSVYRGVSFGVCGCPN